MSLIYLFWIHHTIAGDFAAIVQFVKGEAVVNEKPVKFKDIIRRDQIISVSDQSFLKLVTQERCIAVIYGPAKIKAPGERSSWQLREGTGRWICQENYQELIELEKAEISLRQGEVLLSEARMVVVDGQVVFQKQVLPKHKWIDAEQMQPIDDTQSDYEIWKWNRSFERPKESVSWRKPHKPWRSKWYVGPIVGGGGFNHDSNVNVSTESAGLEGGQLVTEWAWGKRSLLGSLSMRKAGAENSDIDFNNLQNGQIINGSELESYFANLGIRFNRERSWSFFTYVGIGSQSLEARYFKHSFFEVDEEVDYLSLYLSGGIDKIFFEQTLGWGGIKLQAELFFTTSVVATGSQSFSKLPPEEQDQVREIDVGVTSSGFIFSLLFFFQNVGNV